MEALEDDRDDELMQEDVPLDVVELFHECLESQGNFDSRLKIKNYFKWR